LDYEQSSLSQELATRYDPKKTIFLVMWWSQGSQVINETILTLLDTTWPDVKKLSNIQFLIIWWSKNAWYKDQFDYYENCKCFGFLSLTDIAYLYSIADVAITRSSATSVAEQKLFWLRCIYIPLPFTGWNHQYFNALEFLKHYEYDVLLEQKDLTIQALWATLDSLSHYKKQEQMIVVENLLYSHIRLYDSVIELFEQQKKS
jgi:UDP-N-acetylglucosamine:LPS N-acetylglucosamine transferase